jgi:hypothetical protein
MTEEVKNKIALWVNKDKKNDKSPDYTGKITVNGIVFNVSLWNNAEKYSDKSPDFSGYVNNPDEKTMTTQQINAKTDNVLSGEENPFESDDIPF